MGQLTVREDQKAVDASKKTAGRHCYTVAQPVSVPSFFQKKSFWAGQIGNFFPELSEKGR